MKPGLYPDLDRADLPAGLSYSGAKDILKNPALYQWKRRNPQPPTAAMEQGTVTHSLTLGTPQTWRTIDGGRGVTERRDGARAEGLIPVTLDELAEAARMAVAVHRHDEAGRWLQLAPQREVAAIAQDPQTGVWVRCYLDALHPDARYGIDLKTGREGVLADFSRQAVNLGYDLQAATYASVMEWLGLPFGGLAFVIVEKTPPYQVGVRELDGPFLERGRALLRRALDTYADCVESGNWPGLPAYQLVSAPRWALTEGIYA